MCPMADGIHKNGMMVIGSAPDGCFNTVAREATPTPSVNVRNGDIARGMGATPVNPPTADSAVGRGPNPLQIGESIHHNLGNLQEIGDA